MSRTTKVSLVWPAQAIITESLFRHYSMLAEVAGYLTDSSKVMHELSVHISIEDCAAVVHTAMNMANIVYENDIIAVAINMNNVKEAIDTTTFFKSIDKNKKVIAYGEAVACNSSFFEKQECFDYVVAGGQFELGLEIAICHCLGKENLLYGTEIKQEMYEINGKTIFLNCNIVLPPSKWGMPKLDKLPIESYLKIGKGELHITACKGCSFDCEFCNEKYVSGDSIKYRNIDQIVQYLCFNQVKANSVYLDASTFTYDRNWVITLCKTLVEIQRPIMEWKTCTRLDCLDEELLFWMGKANCKRLSIGVESMSLEIQKRNHKLVEKEKLSTFSELCHVNGITPRALLIIGLKGQSSNEIEMADETLREMGIQTRFRVLQDFSFMLKKEEIVLDDFNTLNRWLIYSPFPDTDINKIRKYEYPEERKNQNFA